MIVVLLGPPGSGKGTQAKRLAADRSWPQLSTGDMLRSAIHQGSQLGAEAKRFMDQGNLVPDSVVVGLIAERSQASDCQKGFILDGFPRTIVQAEALDRMLKSEGREVRQAIQFQISDEELILRLGGRRTCMKCGAMFHVEAMPPKREGICDQCSGSLVQREDDHVDVIRKRLAIYHQQTEPLIGFYRAQNKLRSIDGMQSASQVEKTLLKALDS